MISKIIQFSLKQRLFIIMTTVIVAVLGLLALLLGGLRVLGCESSNSRCSLAVRLGSAMGIICLGICGGLALAFAMLSRSFPAKAIEYDNQLSGVSYIILGCMLGIILIGLCLCFYRAIKGPQTNQNIWPSKSNH